MHRRWQQIHHPLIEFAILHDWQLASEHILTRKGRWGQDDSQPDLIWSSEDLLQHININKILDTMNSGHYPLDIDLYLNQAIFLNQPNPAQPRHINSNRVDEIISKLQSFQDTIKDFDDIHNLLIEECRKCPLSKQSARNKTPPKPPWWNEACNRAVAKQEGLIYERSS